MDQCPTIHWSERISADQGNLQERAELILWGIDTYKRTEQHKFTAKHPGNFAQLWGPKCISTFLKTSTCPGYSKVATILARVALDTKMVFPTKVGTFSGKEMPDWHWVAIIVSNMGKQMTQIAGKRHLRSVWLGAAEQQSTNNYFEKRQHNPYPLVVVRPFNESKSVT